MIRYRRQSSIASGLPGVLISWLLVVLLTPTAHSEDKQPTNVKPEAVLSGVRAFFEKTAVADGSFRPGMDPAYEGMSDTAYSDLAAVTYAVALHKTFGWELP